MTTTETAVDEGDQVWVPEVDFATRLRLVRRELGRRRGETLTQGDMAELVGVPKNRWQQWEAGLAYPRDLVSIARKIAEVSGVDAAWLIGLGDFDFTPVPTGGSSKTYSRCTGGIPGWTPDFPPFDGAGCRIPHDSEHNVFWSIEDIRMATHDGPKPLKEERQREDDTTVSGCTFGAVSLHLRDATSVTRSAQVRDGCKNEPSTLKAA